MTRDASSPFKYSWMRWSLLMEHWLILIINQFRLQAECIIIRFDLSMPRMKSFNFPEKTKIDEPFNEITHQRQRISKWLKVRSIFTILFHLRCYSCQSLVRVSINQCEHLMLMFIMVKCDVIEQIDTDGDADELVKLTEFVLCNKRLFSNIRLWCLHWKSLFFKNPWMAFPLHFPQHFSIIFTPPIWISKFKFSVDLNAFTQICSDNCFSPLILKRGYNQWNDE